MVITIASMGQIKIITATTNEGEHEEMKSSALYKCHDLNVKDFLTDISQYITSNTSVENHHIISDFNVDIFNTG